MFIFEFLRDANFLSLLSFKILVYLMINNINNIDHFTNSERDRLNWFETILQY